MEATTGILAQIFSVFEAVIGWIVGAVMDVVPMFYTADSGLTILGILAIIGLAFSVTFLLIGIIQRFLRFGSR